MRDLKKFLNENISIQIDEQKKNKTIENFRKIYKEYEEKDKKEK